MNYFICTVLDNEVSSLQFESATKKIKSEHVETSTEGKTEEKIQEEMNPATEVEVEKVETKQPTQKT